MEGWKEKFLELYTMPDPNKLNEALELKQKHLPSKLYRYRRASGKFYALNEIAMGQIHLSHYKDFNDPFDGCSVIKDTNLSRYLETVKKRLENDFRKFCTEDEFERVFSSPQWYNKLLTLAMQKNDTTRGLKTNHADSPIKACLNPFLDCNQSINKVIHNYTRIACFTTKPTNLPMWNLYGEEYQGICLEYETSKIKNTYYLNQILPVCYTDTLPDGIEYLQQEINFATFYNYFSLHKLKDWAYEDEWRLIYNLGLKYTENISDFGEKGVNLQFIQPSRVLLGAKINPENEKKVQEVCEMCQIPAVKMKVTQFGLQEESL